MVLTNHSHIYLSHVDCNHVHGGDVSQSKDAYFESLMPDIFHPQSLTCEEEGLASCPDQDDSVINPSSLSIPKDPYVPDTQLDQTSGFDNSHYMENIFTHSSGDYPMHPYVDPTKPPKFDDPSFECLGNH